MSDHFLMIYRPRRSHLQSILSLKVQNLLVAGSLEAATDHRLNGLGKASPNGVTTLENGGFHGKTIGKP